MKVLAILGSSRSHGYTRKTLEQVLAKTDFTIIDLNDRNITPYDYDQSNVCDDHAKIITNMIKADAVVFATPVYWYTMSAQMKIFFDRFSDLLTTHTEKQEQLIGKRCYLFATGTDAILPEGFEVPFRRTCEYLGMKYRLGLYIGKDDSHSGRDKIQTFLKDLCHQDGNADNY